MFVHNYLLSVYGFGGCGYGYGYGAGAGLLENAPLTHNIINIIKMIAPPKMIMFL